MSIGGVSVGVTIGQRVGAALDRDASGAVSAPDAPTIGLATAGDTDASVAFTPAGTGEAATSFTVTSTPGGFTATGASSPLVVTGLSNGTAYTFVAKATNAGGDSANSSATGSIVPMFFWGDAGVAVWNPRSTTPNEDGAISAIADCNTGAFPLAQAVEANQPARSGGATPIITYDVTGDFMDSTDATLIAMGDLTSHDATIFAQMNVIGSGTGRRPIGWQSADLDGNTRLETSAAEELRIRKAGTIASTGLTPSGSMFDVIAQWDSGAEGDAFVYSAGVLIYTLAVTGETPEAPTTFTTGAGIAAASPLNVAFGPRAAMGRAATSAERTEWAAYLAAGYPLRSA